MKIIGNGLGCTRHERTYYSANAGAGDRDPCLPNGKVVFGGMVILFIQQFAGDEADSNLIPNGTKKRDDGLCRLLGSRNFRDRVDHNCLFLRSMPEDG